MSEIPACPHYFIIGVRARFLYKEGQSPVFAFSNENVKTGL
jgi:hypothetical protein